MSVNYLELNRRAYDATADQYAERIASDMRNDEPIVDRVLNWLAPGSEAPILALDVGCGAGANLAMFEARGLTPIGIDLSLEMCRHARACAGPATTVVHDDFLAHDFGTRRFDLVFAKAFIHLFPTAEFQRVLAKLDRLAEASGIIYIATTVEADTRVGPLRKSDYRGAPSRFRRRLSQSQVRSALEGAGGTIVDEWVNQDPRSQKRWQNYCVRPSRGVLR